MATVEASFFWIMLLIAFVFGAFAAGVNARRKAKELREAVVQSRDILVATLVVLRARNQPLPMLLHKRIIHLRDATRGI